MTTISIITVCRDAAGVIENCLRSVAGQTVPVQHIVIDGASTDSTVEIVEKHQQEHPCVQFLSEPDDGIYDALNKGIVLATGDVVGLLNADDFYRHERVLENVVSVIDSSGADACYGDLEYVAGEDSERIVRRWCSGPYDHRRFLWGWMPPHPTFFVRRKVYERFGGFRRDLGTAADYELMLRFLYKEGISATYLPDVLIRMRAGGVSNNNLRARIKANRMDRLAWKTNGLKPFPWTIPLKPVRKLGQWL